MTIGGSATAVPILFLRRAKLDRFRNLMLALLGLLTFAIRAVGFRPAVLGIGPGNARLIDRTVVRALVDDTLLRNVISTCRRFRRQTIKAAFVFPDFTAIAVFGHT